ncbi:unnamed protein product, partial [Mesorhabditis belari]|uniref:Acyltransferase n=1 Tax=Mesorhabditis belari TaxID=2138241 RepID=A0AAF3FR26_9BILA
MTTAPHQKSGAVQALRALAIIAVILFHLKKSFAPNGFLGVDIFFVISGYLMTMILTKSGISIDSTLTFLQRRIKRIVPLYLLTIASVLIASRLFLLAKDLRILRIDALWSLGLVSNMQPLFHEFDYFEELTEYKLLTHTWSLAAELQYYLIVPLLMLLLLSIGFAKRILIALVIISASLGLQISLPPNIAFGFLPCRVWQFFFGLIVFELSQKPKQESINRENGKEYKILVEVESEDEEKAQSESIKRAPCSLFPSSLLCGFSYFSAILTCYFSTGPTPILDLWILQYIGDISYILYLVHWPVIILLKYVSFEEVITPQNISLALLITVTISVIIHHTLEQKFIVGSFFYALAWIAALIAISSIFILLPIQEIKETSNFQSFPSNHSKDCVKLSKTLDFPKLENFKVTLGGYEKAGQDTGNGSFNVLLLGNSFMRFGFPHFYKALNKRYKKLYFHAITTCMPFENSGVVDRKEEWSKRCNGSRIEDLKLLETAKPKMIFISIGYSGGFVKQKIEANDSWVKEAVNSFNIFGKYADFIVIDTPFYAISSGIADDLQKRMKKKIPPMPKEKSQFLFKKYLDKYKYAFKRIEMIRKKCTKCHFVEVQSEFCDEAFCQSFDYDCGRTLYTTDGIHMTDFAKNLLYHRLKAEIDIIYTITDQKKKR